MLRRLREYGPAVLVPLAWLVVVGAQLGRVGDDAMFIAHLVMVVFITGFLLTGWSAMATGALAGWRAIMVVGLGITLTGVVGFRTASRPALLVSLVGWMVLPAAGLAYTARLLPAARLQYTAATLLSLAGAGCYVAWLLGASESIAIAGLGLVCVGQTIGIVDATVRG